jgi:hypothetical protein
MSEVNRREWLDVTRLDFRHVYRSPLVEILIVLFLYISVNVARNVGNNSIYTGFGETDNFLLFVDFVTNFVFSTALEQLWMTLLFVIPLLVAFTTARALEDGSFRTILSYPIKRWHLLVMRVIIPTVIVGTCATVSVFLAVFLMIPAPWHIGSLFLLLSIFWLALLMVCASIVFLAVLTKRMIVTALGGAAVWFSLASASYMTGTPEILKWIGNPIMYMASYIYGEEIPPSFPIWLASVPTTEAVLGFVGLVSAVIVLLLLLSVWLFKRMEV